MSEEERNLAIAREGLEAFQRGDIEAFLNLLDPDVEIYSPPDLANPAQFRGRDAGCAGRAAGSTLGRPSSSRRRVSSRWGSTTC